MQRWDRAPLMCTLIVLRGLCEEYPLVVAANRDEFYARPSVPPAPWEDGAPFIAGRDEQDGGSWLGATREGFVVGLTNRPATAESMGGRPE